MDLELSDSYIVQRPKRGLSGKISIPGSKNSAMPILAAAALCPSPVRISNLPQISDIRMMLDALGSAGAEICQLNASEIIIDGRSICDPIISKKHSSGFRGAVYVMAVLAARLGRAKSGEVGGDRIRGRSFGPHQRAVEGFGGTFVANHDGLAIEAAALNPGRFTLDDKGISASCTAILLAATLKGQSDIEIVSTEIEVDDVCIALRTMGAQVVRVGRSVSVSGPLRSPAATIRIPYDPVYLGTIGVAASITGGRATFLDLLEPTSRISSILSAFKRLGVCAQASDHSATIFGRPSRGGEIITGMFPMFPADLQPPFTALLASISARSRVVEDHYDDRFDHVAALVEMGANIRTLGNELQIGPPSPPRSSCVFGEGIRETAAVLIFGLTSPAPIVLKNMANMHRGYENLPKTLRDMGAPIATPEIC